MIIRYYVYMLDENMNHIIESGARYLVGSSVFSIEDAHKAIQAHSKLALSTKCYAIGTAKGIIKEVCCAN